MPLTCPTCLLEWADDLETCPDDDTALSEGDPLIGRTVGSYRVLKRLGKGGMGSVYLAEHPMIGSAVAIKFLHAQFSRDKLVVDRFFNEARAVNLIGHDNILKILDLSVTEDGRHYFVMEFLEGRSLQGLIEGRQKAIGAKWVPLEMAGPILLQCCKALAAAHDKGIVHRDLKPDNVFLVKHDGRLNVVKVVDFGIARLTDSSGASTGATQTGMVMGTPAFMSPEQASGATSKIGPRSDIYSMGVMAFQMCCGRLPFIGKSFGELLAQHLQQEPPRPRALNPSLPEEVEEVILTALRKKQGERFQSMTEMSDALRAALQAHGLPVEPPLDPESSARSGSRPSIARGRPAMPRPGASVGTGAGAADTLVDGLAFVTVPRRNDDVAGATVSRPNDDVAGATVPIQAVLKRAPRRPGSQPPLDESRRAGGGVEGSVPGRSRPAQAEPAAVERKRNPAPLVIGLLVGAAVISAGIWFGRSGRGPGTAASSSGKAGSAPAGTRDAAPPASATEKQSTWPIAVDSQPPGAEVLATWEGGSGGGVAPFTLAVPRGATVDLRFSLAGYILKRQRVVADGPRHASVALRPLEAAAAGLVEPDKSDGAAPATERQKAPAPKRPRQAKDKAAGEDLINPF